MGIEMLYKVCHNGTKERMHSTMSDFHNFGLIFAGIMHCLPQRLKSTLFEIFSNGGCMKGTNNVDFSLWGNRATTWEYFLTFSSETKIMKIIHSIVSTLPAQTVRNWKLIFVFFSLKQSRVIGKHGFQSIFAFYQPKTQILGTRTITIK